MAKKTAAEEAPESKPVKKTPARKSAKSTSKKATEAKKTAATAAIASISSTTPPENTPKTDKKQTPRPARTKSPAKEQQKPDTLQQEKATPPPAQHSQPSQPQTILKVRRESFRPNKPQQENKQDDSTPVEGFSQPETVGGEINIGNGRNKRRNRNRNRRQNDERQEDSRPQENSFSGAGKLDVKNLAKKAWKIFLAEVTEEGLALMDDNTSREAAKRAFRVAEFFMNEEARRKQFRDPQQRPTRPDQQQNAVQAQDKDENENQPSSEEN